ncbi:Soluble lytic murein transglycosylase [bacterium HR30]|nr:Soluble lytic murein transglycosylase [bacterium HR30]
MLRLGLLVFVVMWCGLGCSSSQPLGRYDPRVVWLRWQSAGAKQEQFRAAWRAWRLKQDDEAYRLFRALAYAYPELADHSWFYAGLAADRSGRRREAVAAMLQVVGEFPRSVFYLEAATFLAEWQEEAGQVESARGWASRVLGAGALPELRQRATLVQGRCEERAGNVAAAAKVFREVWEQARVAAVRARARGYLRALRAAHPMVEPTSEQRVQEAEWAVRDGDWALARELAEPLAGAPDSEVRARALLVLAEVAYGLGQWEDALTGWWAVANRYPEARVAPMALHRMGTVLWNRERNAAADRVFAELIRRYPAADLAAKALLARARIAYSEGARARAQTLLRDADRFVFDPDVLREVHWWRGWVAFKTGAFGEAASFFQRLGADDERAQYWLARALEEQGRKRQARELYTRLASGRPRFYAYLADRQLRGLGSLPFQLSGLAVAPPDVPVPRPPTNADPFHLERWQHLLVAGVLPLARKELAAVAQGAVMSDAAWREFLVAAWWRTHAYADALRALATWRDLPTEERQRLEYPLAFYALVQKAAMSYGLDPLLLLAVMRQESLFDPEVCSPAGACGLMQLMPNTAQRLGAGAGLDPNRIDLFDPEQNIDLAARHLRELLDRFSYDPVLALAAYNAGEEAVRRWLARTNRQPPDEFVEDIAYRETRDYVKRVWTHYLRYQALYLPAGGGTHAQS